MLLDLSCRKTKNSRIKNLSPKIRREKGCDMAAFKSREELIAAEKGLKEAIEKKHGKTAEELCWEREKRVNDAIQLKEPDRVPVVRIGSIGCRFGFKSLLSSSPHYGLKVSQKAAQILLLYSDRNAYKVNL